MQVWRMMAYHDRDRHSTVLAWLRTNGVIAVGHGEVGDLKERSIADEQHLSTMIREYYDSPENCANGGRSLWNLLNEVKIGDLVIVNAPRPQMVMRVTGEYYFVKPEDDSFYEHRRKAEFVPVDPSWLWRISGKIAPGQGIFPALVKCSNTISESELAAAM